MNEMQVMNIQGVDCYEKDGTAYLKLANVASGLGFTQTQNKNGVEYTSIRWETINRYLEEIGFPNKLGKDDYIPENIFYRLAMKAKNETAEKFQAKVADEIIPSIRKHGMYATEELLNDPDLAIRAFTALKEEREKRRALEEENARMRPKEIFADAVSASQTSILIGDLAKLISQNGIQIGQKRLFEWMRSNGYLMSVGTSRNMPTQRSMGLGLLEVKESNIQNPDGSIRITRTTKVTGKGQLYFINRFLGKEGKDEA